jgi:peroxiredoxin Q/BCP
MFSFGNKQYRGSHVLMTKTIGGVEMVTSKVDIRASKSAQKQPLIGLFIKPVVLITLLIHRSRDSQQFGVVENFYKRQKTALLIFAAMITHLNPGDPAPDFSGLDEEGKAISLKDYAGKKLALYFYPHDLTPTCTVQACNLRDNLSSLKKHGIEVVGVSEDDGKKHQKFIGKHKLTFPLIADTEHEVLKAYGVWGQKKFMGREYIGTHRTTFLINEEGKIHDVIKKVKSKVHSEQIMESFTN